MPLAWKGWQRFIEGDDDRQRVARTACVRASLPICGDLNRTLPIQRSGEAQGWTVCHLPSTPTVNEIPPTLRSDPAGAIGDAAAPPHRPGLRRPVSRVQNCSRRVPACHGHGAIVVSRQARAMPSAFAVWRRAVDLESAAARHGGVRTPPPWRTRRRCLSRNQAPCFLSAHGHGVAATPRLPSSPKLVQRFKAHAY